MERLMVELSDIPDPRGGGGRRRHVFREIVGIAILAMFAGARTYYEMEDFGKTHRDWLKEFMGLAFGIPSHDTLNRAIAAMSPTMLERKFRRWSKRLAEECSENPELADILSFDGKAMRRAGDGEKIPMLVGAYDAKAGVVAGQEQVCEKSNEITVMPKLIEAFDIKGKVVTADAMGCQKRIAGKIMERGGDYMLSLKRNHGTAYDEMTLFMTDSAKLFPKEFSACKTLEKGHGRIELRKCSQSCHLDWFQDRPEWAGLKSVCLVESERTTKGVAASEKRLYLSSLPLGAEKALAVIRGHWGIENKVHHRLDVQLAEDCSRARKGHAARNLSIIRRLVLNVLTKLNPQVGINRHQKQIAADKTRLKEVVKSFVPN